LVLLALYSVVLLVEQLRTPTTVSFEIALRRGDIWGRGFYPCFFYDTGRGFSEAETVCFDYKQGLQAGFQRYQITLPTHRPIHQLRFDPLAEPGVVALRNLTISRYRTANLNLTKEFGHTLYPLHHAQLSLEGDTLVARLSTDDPYFMLVDGFDRRTGPGAWVLLLKIVISLLLCAVLFALAQRARTSGRWKGAEFWRGLLRRRVPQVLASMRALTLAALATFLVAMIGAKVFALLTSAFHYWRRISLMDLAAAPAESAAIGLLAATMVLIVVGADDLCARRWWTAPLRILLFGCQSLVASALVLLALFEVLCCYVFSVWGSYVDGTLIQIAYRSATPDSLRYYLTRPSAAIAALGVVALTWFGACSFRFFRRRGLPRGLVVVLASIATLWSLEALRPLRAPGAYDPAVSSPMVAALQRSDALGETLDPGVNSPKLASFQLPPPRPVPAAYRHYRGAAAGQDVIFVVLESVRRADVSLYGYARETTPNMTRLAHHAMVFSNVYISQPRSCKTMESFTLGTYPDPRYDSLAWDADRILGRPSFWGILARQGCKVYLGVNADVENDGFGGFMRAAAGPALDRTVGQADLMAHYGEVAKPVGSMGNDTVLVDDFLQWYRARQGPSAAVVWFAEAHHPYWATTKKFPEHSLVDQYDNCIYSADAAVGHLIDELETTGRHPLVLIFGDHGESFGEDAGDRFHGRYLYNQSVRIPMMLYSSALFPERQDFNGRISMKDVPATIFYLLGHDEPIGQSEVAFSKQSDDPVYMSNVYGGFKLGMVNGPAPEKFMYFPSTKLDYLFDLTTDPGEETNLVASRPREEIQRREEQLIEWYFYQTHYLDQGFPRRTVAGTTSSVTAAR
jgi:glucan phosphoethanolaminetransferase (alkaline phosphatase superfamily)